MDYVRGMNTEENVQDLRFLLPCLPLHGVLVTHAEEGAGAPFVLVDNYNIVVEDGVIHGEGDTGEIT